MVQILHANGIPLYIIGKAAGVSVQTLRKYYTPELRDAHWEIEACMVAALINAARKGSWSAARYWLMVHSRNPKWKVQMLDPDHNLNVPGGTTITIHGGLPADALVPLTEYPADPPPMPPARSNGAGTDPTY